MQYSDPKIYPNIIPANTIANANSIPIFCPDHGVIEFTIQFDGTANYNIGGVMSNQELPPALGSAVGPTNEYNTVAIQDVDTEVTYVTGSPFNPSTAASGGGALPAGAKTFRVQTGGARWFFIQLSGYVAGTLVKADAGLFSGN